MTSSSPSLKVAIGQASVAGIKEQNDDAIGVSIPSGEALLLKGIAASIADGVSAASRGKEAAETSVNGFLLDYYSTPDSWSVKKSGQKVINALNRWLYGQSQSGGYAAEKGYVCTLSSLIIHSRSGYIFHIGDSRIYRIRANTLEQLTRDHSSQVSSNVAYLTRAMGLNLSPKVDYSEVEVEVGDLYLFTTDGIHDFISEKQILENIDAEDLDSSASRLITESLQQKSGDNLSALLLRVDRLPEASHEEMQKFLMERPFPPLLHPGQVMDGLEVEKVLFESARSQLYRVRDKETDEVYAMKTPSVNFSDDPAYIERFVTEEWIGKRVEHENLIAVKERAIKPRFLYYLMEELDGDSIASYIKKRGGKLSPSELLPILKQVVSGVRALHRKETLHQDLKLDNIMIDADGNVKVIDYGSCKVASLSENEVAHDRQEALGTIDYGAPEYRIEGGGSSTKSDQFSIAMIAYRIFRAIVQIFL